jgi:hypothetical protein
MPSARLAVEIDDHDRFNLVTTSTKDIYPTARHDAGCSMDCAKGQLAQQARSPFEVHLVICRD